MNENLKRAIQDAVNGHDIADVVDSEKLTPEDVAAVSAHLQKLAGAFGANQNFASELTKVRLETKEQRQRAAQGNRTMFGD